MNIKEKAWNTNAAWIRAISYPASEIAQIFENATIGYW